MVVNGLRSAYLGSNDPIILSVSGGGELLSGPPTDKAYDWIIAGWGGGREYPAGPLLILRSLLVE